MEDSLKESYERFLYKQELEVISKLKRNPRKFFHYARKKSLIQSNVKPLVDNNGVHHDKLEMAKIQGDQNCYIGQYPFNYLNNISFIEDLNQSDIGLHEIEFDLEEV